MKEYAKLTIMSVDTSFILKTILGILGGLLISTGILPAESKDVFTTDATTASGYIITIVSTIYLLEHALVKVKDDLMYTTETPAETPTTPTAPVTPTTPTPTEPLAQTTTQPLG